MKHKVLIIDDDRELCHLLRKSLGVENIEADIYHTGKEGISTLKHKGYQLVILDIMMPGMDGFRVLGKIREANRLSVLILTAKNDNTSKIVGLRPGANDYSTKPFDMDRFVARVRSLIRRYTNFSSLHEPIETLIFKELVIDLESRSVLTENRTLELPPKEFDVLVYCVQNQGKILTKRQIFEEVWQEPYVYDDNNIMTIISKLRKKIEDDPSSPIYIQTVRGIGCRSNRDV